MEGIVNVLKPPGMTSSNVVSDIRRLFGLKRVGHTGTLDPGAAGVLPICLGRATRLFDILVDKQKEYLAEVYFGIETDTQDSYGEVLSTQSCDISLQQFQWALSKFHGKQKQIAPAYSALKVGGRPLYEIARKDGDVPVRIREYEVFEQECIAQTSPNRFLFRIICSRGTYVRTLCKDVGQALGVPAHMSFLLRTVSGNFHIEESHSVEELAQMKEQGELLQAIIPVEKALSFLPGIVLHDPYAAVRLCNGCSVSSGDREGQLEEGCLCRVYHGEDIFLGVGIYGNEGLRLKIQYA